MATGRILERRPVCRDAGYLHLFCAPAVFPIEPLMQWVRYWKSFAFEKLTTCTRTADLATRFLGHAVAAFGKLRFEMAVRRGQPGPRGISMGGG